MDKDLGGGKSIYQDSGIMRTDGSLQVDPNGDRSNVGTNGKVGIGTTTPGVNAKLEVAGNIKLGADDRRIFWDWPNRAILQTDVNGASGGGKVIRFMNSMSGGGSNPQGGFEFTTDGGGVVMKITDGKVGIGTTTPQGMLDVNGAIYQRGGQLHADYVFENDYDLESIREHADFMWKEKHLKAIPKAKVDEKGIEVVEVGSHRKGIVEELEKAHIYIARLNEENEALEARLAKLEAMLNIYQ